MSKSNRPSQRKKSTQPTKPRPDFPLFAHAAGYWAKKIRGKTCYFGKIVNDPKGAAALQKWLDDKDDLLAGRVPRGDRDGLTLADLCNRFLTVKLHERDGGEITPRTWDEYKATTDRLIAVLGKNRLVDDLAADDFEALRVDIAKQWGPHRLGDEVQRTRTVFKYAYEAGLIDRPVRYGPQFKKPSKTVMRRHKAEQGPRVFQAEEIRAMVDAASVPLRAMILLGINCGFGGSDCGELPLSAVDWDGWVTYPRPKTGIDRRCALWGETIEALRVAIAERRTPKDPAAEELVFVTRLGKPWAKSGKADAVVLEMRKLLKRLKITGGGRGFYGLRHTFRTIADSCHDYPAIRVVMGHADNSIDATYREHIDDERLQAVAEHVRRWLFPRGRRIVKE
jgi:integrase